MFNYKDSHGGFYIPVTEFRRFIDPDYPDDGQKSTELPRLALKPATLAQIKQTIAWIGAIAEAMNKTTDELKQAEKFIHSCYSVVFVLIKNFSGYELV